MADAARRDDDATTGAERRRSRLFRNGNSQALRVPAALAFETEGEVEVWREGDRLIVRPVKRGRGFRFSYDDPERIALGLRRAPPSDASPEEGAWDVDDRRWTDEIFGDDADEDLSTTVPRVDR